MTTLQPIEKSEKYRTSNADEAHELVKDAMRQSTFKFVSVRKVLFDTEQWEVNIDHEHARY